MHVPHRFSGIGTRRRCSAAPLATPYPTAQPGPWSAAQPGPWPAAQADPWPAAQPGPWPAAQSPWPPRQAARAL